MDDNGFYGLVPCIALRSFVRFIVFFVCVCIILCDSNKNIHTES